MHDKEQRTLEQILEELKCGKEPSNIDYAFLLKLLMRGLLSVVFV
ncbi:hypothetical protein [Peribacillus sp. SCS-155]